MKKQMEQWWSDNKKILCQCIIWAFVFGLAAHAFQFFNFQYAHDSLDGLFVMGRENYHKAELGRIFSPVYRFVFGGNFSAPWLIGFLALLWVGIAAFFVVKTLGINSKISAVFICGVMVTSRTVTALAATFIHDLDADMFALMLACIAVYLWKEKIFGWWLVGAVALCGSLGLYQSYITVAIVLIALVLMLQLAESEKFASVAKNAAGGAVMGILGGAMYAVVLKITPVVTSVEFAERGNSVTSIKLLKMSDLPALVAEAYTGWLEYFINVPTNWAKPQIVAAVNIALILAVPVMAVMVVIKKKTSVLNMSAVAAVVALLPLAMNLIRVLSVEEYHDLMTYAFVFLYVAAVALAEKLEIKPVGAVVGLCVALVVFCSVQTANEVYLKRNLSYQATYARMSFVLHDMEQMGYDVENEEVYILNEVPMADYEDFGAVNQLWAMEFDNVITSDKKSIENYFEYVFDYPIRFASEERANKALLSEECIRMPSYPDEGYMEYIDGVLMVKLQPNQYHIKELEKLEAAEAAKAE